VNKLLLLLAGFAGLAAPASSPAQDPAAILEARRAGLIGERYDGYVGLVTANTPADLRRQVAALNIRRRSLYSNLAARKGVSPEEVGITAACTLLRRINVGEYYLQGQGGWQRYTPGRSPVPTYCG
jgi:uncharacterized protein YdbL (DUF1318 family)